MKELNDFEITQGRTRGDLAVTADMQSCEPPVSKHGNLFNNVLIVQRRI